MTVAALDPAISYLEDGVTVNFAVPFRYLATDLSVSRVATDGTVTTLAHGTDWSASAGPTDAGGALTVVATVAGATLRIRRETPRSQATDYQTGDTFPADTHERALDRAMLIDQEQDAQIADTAARALLVPDGEIAGVLPAKADRAGMLLGFDAEGNPVEATPGGADSALRSDLARTSGTPGSALSGFLQDGAGAVGRSALSKLRDLLSPYDFGATGLGVVSDRTALLAVDAIAPWILPRGTFRLTADTTLTHDILFLGGVIEVDNCLLTINGAISAGFTQIFSCINGGEVVISKANNPVGYAEWWGCAVGDAAHAVITAALATLPCVKLAMRDYLLGSTLLIPPYRRLEGAGAVYENGQATRLLGVGATMTVLQLGDTGYPGSLNGCPAGAEVANLYVGRNTAPTLASDCVGVLVGYSRVARMTNLWSDHSINAFRFFGSIAAVAEDCRGKRSSISTTNPGDGSLDKFRAFEVAGNSALGAAGSNASLRLVRPVGECNVTITDSAGLSLNGRCTDFFCDELETVGGAVGIKIVGDRAGAAASSSNTDIRIQHPVLDQCTVRGIDISDLNKWGSIEIGDPYVGPVAGAIEAIRGQDCEGTIAIKGGQLRMDFSTSPAIAFASCRAPRVEGTTVIECRDKAVSLQAVTGGKIAVQTENVTQVLDAVVQLVADCKENVIDCGAHGEAGKVTVGYHSLAASNDLNEFHKTRLRTGVVGTKTDFAVGSEAASVTYGV